MKPLSFLLFLTSLAASTAAFAESWFEDIKQNASDVELHQFLHEMPKGGDLHLHITGSFYSEWWLEHAIAAEEMGYEYYTRVAINNCRPYGDNQFGGDPYLMYFRNIEAHRLDGMNECERSEYVRLKDMTEAQRTAWLDSLRLEKPWEGRNEFFETHWQRLGDLTSNPYMAGDLIVRYLQDSADDGLLYIEPQVTPAGYADADGEMIEPVEVARIINARLAEDDAKATGVTWRFQVAILRFTPTAEQSLIMAYQFASAVDPWVAVNMVGREDNDKGYPLRFLPTLRELRKTYNNVDLSIHGGEVDEPNFHVRDTLLLGATRIGHAVNLITDPDMMRLMRYGPYLVEINLISNLLLEYVSDYRQHPFPEYLRTGIPVALSTDDRGMWDSTMTDEFFVAVKEFNLSWDEVKLLSRNSLSHAFLPDGEKQALLDTYNDRIEKFEKKMARRGLDGLTKAPAPKRKFICNRYKVCAP